MLDSDCLVGVWTMANLPGAMAEILEREQASLKLSSVNGQVTYAFDPSGEMRITFDALSAELNGMVEGQEVRVQQNVAGSGTARYAVDALSEQLALSEFGGQGIESSLAINGQVIAERQLPLWGAFSGGSTADGGSGSTEGSAPLPGGPAPENVAISRADASCDGNTLTLQAVEPIAGPAVILERVR